MDSFKAIPKFDFIRKELSLFFPSIVVFFCTLSFDLEEDLIDFFDCVGRYKNVGEKVILYSTHVCLRSYYLFDRVIGDTLLARPMLDSYHFSSYLADI